MAETLEMAPITLRLIPLEVAETAYQPIITPTGENQANSSQFFPVETNPDSPREKALVVYPGEKAELLIHIINEGTRPLYFGHPLDRTLPNDDPHWQFVTLDITDNSLMEDWYQLDFPQRLIHPQEQISATLSFNLPQNFFEQDDTWSSGKPFDLDYEGKLTFRYAFWSPDDPSPPTRYPFLITSDFRLYIRPRSLYLTFLPSLYREVDFIGRLLKIFEETFEPSVQILDNLWAYLDPLTTPSALLPFLAHWVGWKLTSKISLDRQRILVRSAIKLYQWRGTKRGLRYYLHLYTDLPPENIKIQDSFEQGFVLREETRIGENTIIGGGKPYHFIVQLDSHGQPLDELLIREIIEQEKPAFCSYTLEIY